MKFRTLLALSLMVIAVLALAACGGSGQKPADTSSSAPKVSAEGQKYANLKGDATKGKDKFIGTCSACHGPDAKGVTGLGKDLTTSAFTRGLSDADFIAFVVKGRPASDPANTTKVDMLPKGGNPALTDQDLADIVAYARTLQK
jgi:disulfide bond formation protein DsbB